jgi:hypothetical protein
MRYLHQCVARQVVHSFLVVVEEECVTKQVYVALLGHLLHNLSYLVVQRRISGARLAGGGVPSYIS